MTEEAKQKMVKISCDGKQFLLRIPREFYRELGLDLKQWKEQQQKDKELSWGERRERWEERKIPALFMLRSKDVFQIKLLKKEK